MKQHRLDVMASSPGRVCLAGEDLDWMVGPSILAAVNLRLDITVRPHSGRPSHVLAADHTGRTHEIDLHVADTNLSEPFAYIAAGARITACQTRDTVQSARVDVRSAIPMGAGISSSAAVVNATIAALSRFWGLSLGRSEICALAYRVENDMLRTGAGQMDFYGCALGGVIYLDSSNNPPSPVEHLRLPSNARIVIVDTRTPRRTRDVTEAKAERWRTREKAIVRYVERVSEAVAQMSHLFGGGQPSLQSVGRLVNTCQNALRDDLGVSTELIDRCVDACVNAGAAGAKLSGAGMGGCMFALVEEHLVEAVVDKLRNLPVDVYRTKVDHDGLVVTTGQAG